MEQVDALLISPKYTSLHWQALSLADPTDWGIAAEIVSDRLKGRFLQFASKCLAQKYSGFVVLSIDCLLAETIQQFKEGITSGKGKSKSLVTRFLEGQRFQPDFDGPAREAFYNDIRCGLLHQAEAREMWLIRRKQPHLLQKIDAPTGVGHVIDVRRFHEAVAKSLDDYLNELISPNASALRTNLWKKMDHISQVRDLRGALYAAE